MEVRRRIASNLITLRKQLKDEVAQKTADDTLLLATWNIRDFDSNKFGHGSRIKESYYYISEIISAFDIIALQEINADLKALKKVMNILGRNWSFITTDVTEGRSGNKERMTFVFDRNKVSFQNIAGEIVLPETKLIAGKRQFARTPFLVAFQSGWFKFMLCTVHIYYGAKYGAKFERRVKEIRKIGKFISKRADDDKKYNYILLGDFNIVTPDCETMYALEGSGFEVPDRLRRPTNIDEDKFYDQITFKTKPEELILGDTNKSAGVFKYYESVFKDNEYEVYKDFMDPSKRDFDKNGNPNDELGKIEYYKEVWRTFQMSDHYPLWVELKIDFSEKYLENLI
ncbi:MAG: endonuclease/exonuclease/phosphatase family protein [Methanosarcinales archaeon]